MFRRMRVVTQLGCVGSHRFGNMENSRRLLVETMQVISMSKMLLRSSNMSGKVFKTGTWRIWEIGIINVWHIC